jgi:hypothetical protein
MQYTLTLTQRMIAIIVICFCLLCILLFLLGVEIGKKYSAPNVNPAPVVVPTPAVNLPSLPLKIEPNIALPKS